MIRALITRIRQSSFAQGVFSIAGGTVVGQGIGILISPLLTRIYSPDDMGMWGLFVSFVGVVAVGGALRYEVAVVAAREEEEALSLARYALLLAVFTSFIGGTVFEGFRRYHILGYGVFPWWATGVVVVAVIVNVWGQVLRFWFIRKKSFSTVGLFVAGRGVFRAFGQVALYFWQGWGLICGEVFGRLFSVGVLLKDFPLLPGKKCFFLSRGKAILQKYKTYPLVFLPSAFIDTVAMMAPVPVFTAAYGIRVGGMLSLAQRVVSVPLVFLGAAVADVFFGEVAETTRQDARKAARLFWKSTLRLGSIALVIGGGLWAIAPWGIPVIFGKVWYPVGKMLQIMVPWFVGMLTVSPISRLVFLSRYPWAKLVYDILALSVATLPLWLSVDEPLKALRLVSWLQAGLYGVYWFILLLAVRQGLEVK